MYKEFEAIGMHKHGPDSRVDVINTNGHMMICTNDAAIFITREQAAEFFGLVPIENLKGLVPKEMVALYHRIPPTPASTKDVHPKNVQIKANKPNQTKLTIVK